MAEKNKEKGKRYFLWFILFLLSIYLFITIQERRGYCFDKGAYIHELYTEQELIYRGIEYVNAHELGGGIWLGNKRLESKRYLNIEEFKRSNPNCCSLTTFINEGIDGYPDDDGYGYVRIEYLRHYVENLKPDREVIFLEYTPCGELQRKASFSKN